MAMTKIVRPTRTGRITIPIEFRRELGMEPDTLLQMSLEDNELRLKPVQNQEQSQGSAWLRELYEYFAPVRQEAIEKGYTEDEINEWIDEAVREVRANRG